MADRVPSLVAVLGCVDVVPTEEESVLPDCCAVDCEVELLVGSVEEPLMEPDVLDRAGVSVRVDWLEVPT